MEPTTIEPPAIIQSTLAVTVNPPRDPAHSTTPTVTVNPPRDPAHSTTPAVTVNPSRDPAHPRKQRNYEKK